MMEDSTPQIRVLCLSKTSDYRHASIPFAISALTKLGQQSGAFTMDATEDSQLISIENLFIPAISSPTSQSHPPQQHQKKKKKEKKKYDVLLFLQTSGDFLTKLELDALKTFMASGGGFVGIHAASCGMPRDEWYIRLIGAGFGGHPIPQDGVVVVEDGGHDIMTEGVSRRRESWGGYYGGCGSSNSGRNVLGDVLGGCEYGRDFSINTITSLTSPPTSTSTAQVETPQPQRRTWHDEFYNFDRNPAVVPSIHVLLSVDETSYSGGIMGGETKHPLAWCQEFEGGGRSWYTALGHFEDAYMDDWFMGQVLGAVRWVSGRPGREVR